MRILGEGRFGRAARAMVPAAVLALGVGLGLEPRPAQAQFFNWGNNDGWGNNGGTWGSGGGWGNGGDWDGMGPAQVYRAMGEHGFRIVAPLRRNGAVFVAEVVDRRGRRERLIVAAADGQILQRFILNDQQRQPRSARMLPGDDLEQQMDRVDRSDLSPPVPPASIPDAGVQNPIYGNGDDNSTLDPVPPRSLPRLVKPVKPRLVERTPDMIQQDQDPNATQPTRLKIKPTEPQRLPGTPGTASDRVIKTPAVTASRPLDPIGAPTQPAPAASMPPEGSTSTAPSSRMRDPLAIPRNEPKSAEVPKASASATTDAPRKGVPGTVTGAPLPRTPAAGEPAKSGDVPVAPLD